MFKTLLWALERGRHVENGFTILNGANAARAEAIAIAQGFYVINNRFTAIPRTQEIAVEGVNDTLRRNGLLGSIQRLADHLTAKDLA
ncbi:hypothetical protein D3C80_1651030 [compost metagenome]